MPAYLLLIRDYYAALLRTHQAFIAPTQGKLLNYVQRVPLGVVAQITVGPRGEGFRAMYSYPKLAVQSPFAYRSQENRPRTGRRKQCYCEAL